MHTQQRLSFLGSTCIQHLLLGSFLCFYHLDEFLGREKGVRNCQNLHTFLVFSLAEVCKTLKLGKSVYYDYH